MVDCVNSGSVISKQLDTPPLATDNWSDFQALIKHFDTLDLSLLWLQLMVVVMHVISTYLISHQSSLFNFTALAFQKLDSFNLAGNAPSVARMLSMEVPPPFCNQLRVRTQYFKALRQYLSRDATSEKDV